MCSTRNARLWQLQAHQRLRDRNQRRRSGPHVQTRAESYPMETRDLATLDECRQVAELEREIWGYTDAEDVVPPPVLIVSVKRGGILLGAFNAHAQMKGFVYSIPSIKDGRLAQWSHMLGVTPDARGGSLGLRLKLAQREHALQMGVDLIEWTY